jgi:hypothetical protein
VSYWVQSCYANRISHYSKPAKNAYFCLASPTLISRVTYKELEVSQPYRNPKTPKFRSQASPYRRSSSTQLRIWLRTRQSTAGSSKLNRLRRDVSRTPVWKCAVSAPVIVHATPLLALGMEEVTQLKRPDRRQTTCYCSLSSDGPNHLVLVPISMWHARHATHLNCLTVICLMLSRP